MAGIKFKNVVGDYADIEIIKGATIDFNYYWGGKLTPINNTSFIAVWKLAKSANPNEPIYFIFTTESDVSPELPSPYGTIEVGGASGLFRFRMTKEMSAMLPEIQNGKHRLMITDTAGKAIRGLYGRLDIPAQVD